VGLLLLNVSLEQGAFVRQRQQAELERLIEQRDALAEDLAVLEAPQSLAVRATALGMVESPSEAFVRTGDGRVLGVPSPAAPVRQPERRDVRPSPSPASGTP
jgi:hypothetical protein